LACFLERRVVAILHQPERGDAMITYETMMLMLKFGIFLLSFITLVVVLIEKIKK